MSRLANRMWIGAVLMAGSSAFGQAESKGALPPVSKEGAAHFPDFSGPKLQPPPVPVRVPTPIDPALREEARQLVVDDITNSDAILRANAIEAAEKGDKSDAANMALKGLSDNAAVVRFAACVACGNLGYADTKPVLLKLAYDRDSSVRLAARYGLHKIGDNALTQEMLLGLADERRSVRGNTVMLLGMLGEKSAVGPLKRLRNDSENIVRLQVAEALWKLGDRTSLEDLITASVNTNYGSDQVVALLALVGPRDSRIADHVRGLLVADHAEVRITAARCMGTLGSDEGLGVVLANFASKDNRQRSMCAQALGEIARSDTQEPLKALLHDGAPDVRLAAASAILRLQPPATTTNR